MSSVCPCPAYDFRFGRSDGYRRDRRSSARTPSVGLSEQDDARRSGRHRLLVTRQDRPVLPSQSAHFGYKLRQPRCWRASPKRRRAATRHRSAQNPPRRSDHRLRGSRRSFVAAGHMSADRNGAENSEAGQDPNPCPNPHPRHRRQLSGTTDTAHFSAFCLDSSNTAAQSMSHLQQR